MNRILDYFKERKELKDSNRKVTKAYGMFTFCTDHSVAMKGLIWCRFYGNLVMLITK
jgi:hypothetical protein